MLQGTTQNIKITYDGYSFLEGNLLLSLWKQLYNVLCGSGESCLKSEKIIWSKKGAWSFIDKYIY